MEKKKILILHTKYRTTGGEDIAVDNEAKSLEKVFDVETLYFSNQEIDSYIKQIMNSKLNASISSSNGSILISFQSASFSEEDISKGSSPLEKFEVNLDASNIKSTVDEPFQESASEVDLESAELIVSVGRGIEKEENTSIAFDLAEVLGAEVSASRPVVDAGWLPSSRQVGSSGSTVSPKLYFSLV